MSCHEGSGVPPLRKSRMIDDIRDANLGSPGIETDVNGDPAGKDPRGMPRAELVETGHQPLPVLKAIRAKCLDCCCGSTSEVRNCIITTCPLWPFRMGSNPWRDRKVLSPEHRAALVDSRRRLSQSEQIPDDGAVSGTPVPGDAP